MTGYAIISLGGKQYRVQEGERLLVDRLGHDEGATFTPAVLFTGGDGLDDSSAVTVTARVVGHVLGEKVRIGKYKPKSGYRRHNGHRSRLTQIQIESIGGKGSRTREAKEEAPARTSHPPKGYEDLTVAEIKEQVGSWRRPNIEAALAYEREHGDRKGAIEALEAALAAKESD
jgi:large subunit ribosomal protein L21